MDQIIIPGIPAEYAVGVYALIGWLSGYLVNPLTAIAKKLGSTTGVQTVWVSAALALFVNIGFALYSAHAGGGSVNWLGAVTGAVSAFLSANGTYLSRVNAHSKALKQAEPIPVAPTEVLHDVNGQVVGTTAPLTPPDDRTITGGKS